MEIFKALLRFLGHFVTGTVIFLLLAMFAYGVDRLMVFLASQGASQFTLNVLGYLSHGTMVLDAGLVFIYAIVSVYRFIQEVHKDRK